MALIKRPYELSIWIEKLNEDGKKDEIKGAVIGAHDMDYLGKATDIILKRELKGTNTLTFQMFDSYFDSLIGDYVKNKFIDSLIPERKIKLFYQDQWFEFFIKKISEKKILNSYIKTFTCTDAFIDELSRNGYGLTFEEDLYNNVDEMGNFTEEVLEDSLWHYTPEYNWGDFSEFTEERLYKIPISQFGGAISGYKIPFNITGRQKEKIEQKSIINAYTKEERDIELSDDVARNLFWDQQNFDNVNEEKENSLFSKYVENIENDGYIYVPYTCLNFCYGSEKGPEEQIVFDRAATDVALKVNDDYVLSPQSVDPRTIIQFLAIPKDGKVEIDEEGVILNREYQYFMTLKQWNEMIKNNIWYFFEDTQLVSAEKLNQEDLVNATISHTFRYLYDAGNLNILNTYKESYGNKIVKYDGYLEDDDGLSLKGKKYSITDRTEINISNDIDQYVKVYNNSPDEYASDEENLYSSNNWNYEKGEDNKYRVCSKIETRQIIPQLARNLIQNGVNIQSNDGWAPMRYLDNQNNITSGSIGLRTVLEKDSQKNETVKGTALYYSPPHKEMAYIWNYKDEEFNFNFYQINGDFYGCYYFDSDYKKIINRFYKIANKNDDTYKNYKEKSTQVKNEQTQKNQIFKIYTNNENYIHWEINDEKNSSNYTIYNEKIEDKDCNIVNFGAIGQNKIIEKDKIYCLGIELLMDNKSEQNNFYIAIGQGSLISEGDYSFTRDVIKIDKQQLFGDKYLGASTIKWDDLDDSTYTIPDVPFKQSYILFRSPETIDNPYIAIHSRNRALFKKFEFFEAYTKGQDSFEKQSSPFYRYSGRNLFGTEQPNDNPGAWNKKEEKEGEFSYYYSNPFSEEEIRKRILFEDMIMLGSTYEYQNYFIQRLKTLPIEEEETEYFDTCGVESFISSENLKEGSLPLDAAKYTENNYVIETNYINLNKCKYYSAGVAADECDCNYNGEKNSICYYQKFGYCPYRFQTEKHNRKIRTLKISKSNRFNIIQEISKVFKAYPQFYISHKNNGKIDKNKNGLYQKQIFYITERGNVNKIGFRYGKNLKDISRELDSDKIVTKLYVQDVDSELSTTGLCSIKTAEDNISKDSFIIDFSYYIKKGLLDKDEVERDLYGNQIDINGDINKYGYLRKLGYYNKQYDEITNKIINLQNSSFTELEANLNVNLEGIIAAQEQLNKIKKQMEHFSLINTSFQSQSYLNYKTKKEEQEAILLQLIYDTFYTEGQPETDEKYYNKKYGTIKIDEIDNTNPNQWFTQIIDFNKMRETWVNQHLYTKGILGQYNKEYNQIEAWKKEKASYLKMINKITNDFYKKYEPYLKEGTWSDNNYLNDNAYYFGALDVSAQGAIPKVSYNISVIGLDIFEQYKDIYNFALADITWVEDEGMFGINPKTGFPNRLKVLISEITYNLDQPAKDSIKIQNYTTKFEDLFQQVTAAVQSLQYNENIYKRSSNFTALKNIETNSLQGTLDQNNLTLLNTSENNIQLDNEGTKGSDINNHANKYKQNGQGIYFSNDGGQHWSAGVGPSGINADYIKVGSLDASKIRIVDGNYVYFNWNKDGIFAYRDPLGMNTTADNSNDFACFNKYGLSICSENQIKLRSGYNFNGEAGCFNTEDTPGNNIGFYLYNYNGQEIFAAQSQAGWKGSQLKMQGEMVITEPYDIIDNKSYMYIYGKDETAITFFKNKGVLIYGPDWARVPFPNKYKTIKKIGGEDKKYFIFIDGKLSTQSSSEDGYGYYGSPSRGLLEKAYCYIYEATDVEVDGKIYQKGYIIQQEYPDHENEYCYFSYKAEFEGAPKEEEIIGFKKATKYTEFKGGNVELNYFPFNNKYIYANKEVLLDSEGNYKKGYLFYTDENNGVFFFTRTESLPQSQVAIFINNNGLLNGDINNNPNSARRIFSVVQTPTDGGNLKNILTILNNGDISFGGIIENASSLEDFPNIPSIVKSDTDGSPNLISADQIKILLDLILKKF